VARRVLVANCFACRIVLFHEVNTFPYSWWRNTGAIRLR
jgi:hypothetical protein